MEHGRTAKRIHEAERVRQLSREDERFVAALEGLIRKAQRPQDAPRKRQASHTGVLNSPKGQGAVLIGIIEGNPLLQVCSGLIQLAEPIRARPKSLVGY